MLFAYSTAWQREEWLFTTITTGEVQIERRHAEKAVINSEMKGTIARSDISLLLVLSDVTAQRTTCEEHERVLTTASVPAYNHCIDRLSTKYLGTRERHSRYSTARRGRRLDIKFEDTLSTAKAKCAIRQIFICADGLFIT